MLDFVFGYVMGERAAARAATYAREAGAAAGTANTGRIEEVDERVDRLLLVVDAMWSLLKERGYNEEELIERIRSIDVADGTSDGRRTPTPTRCASCKSMNEPGRSTCAYCGAQLAKPTSAFDGL